MGEVGTSFNFAPSSPRLLGTAVDWLCNYPDMASLYIRALAPTSVANLNPITGGYAPMLQ